jgi:hypothetical protein
MLDAVLIKLTDRDGQRLKRHKVSAAGSFDILIC